MRKTAIMLIIVGFLFTFVSVEVGGLDLLFDPVGFLLIFNGVRVLQKLEGGFGFSPASSILLVIVTSLQMFLAGGAAALVLICLRAVLEAALYIQMLAGLISMAKRQGQEGLAHTSVLVLVLSMLHCLTMPLSAFLPQLAYLSGIAQLISWIAGVSFFLLLAFFAARVQDA